MNRIKTITARVIVSCLLIIMATVGIRLVTRNVLIERFGWDNAFTRLVFFDLNNLGDSGIKVYEVDWKALYPFENNNTQVLDPAPTQPSKQSQSITVKLTVIIKDIESSIDSYATEYVVGYNSFVNLAARYNLGINWNIVRNGEYNNVALLDDGYMTSFSPQVKVDESAESLNQFSAWLAEKEIDFLYVQAPNKIYEADAAYGTSDFSNQNIDDLMNQIIGKTHALNLRPLLLEHTSNYHDAFFITDHHWRPETGLWAAGETVKYLNAELGYALDESLFSADNYEYRVAEKSFIGSHGTKLGEGVCTPENFTFIFPKFETQLKYEVISELYRTEREGGFDITYGDIPEFTTPVNKKIAYSTYAHGDNPYMRFQNSLSSNQIKCLILGDSYKGCYVPFMALAFSETIVIDLRYFNGSLKTFIEQNDFDLVIDLCNPGAIGSNESASHTGLFDFR